MSKLINAPPHVYTSVGVDRAAHRRKDQAWLEASWLDRDSRLIIMRDLQVVVGDVEDGTEIFPFSPQQMSPSLPETAIFLGDYQDRAVFSLCLQGDELGEGPRPVEVRAIAPALSPADAGLLAYARALAHWHLTHRCCGRCGRTTIATEAGHARHCDPCKADVFPRTDPAVIVLVTHGDRCVLGRSARFVPGMYSTLAGFVEPGESLESTVRREIFEEAGLTLGQIDYRSSQPWPFPQSLMLGFRATTEDELIKIDPEELEDAQWFTKASLRDEVTRPIRLPGPDSIARYLIEEWLAEGD